MKLKCMAVIGPQELYLLDHDVEVWFRSMAKNDKIKIGQALVEMEFCKELARKMIKVWNSSSVNGGDSVKFRMGNRKLLVAGETVKKDGSPQGLDYETTSLILLSGMGELMGLEKIDEE